MMTNRAATIQHQRGEGTRIPVSLQAVFISSNRGADVVKPPPRRAAYRMFTTPKLWFKSTNDTSNAPTNAGEHKNSKNKNKNKNGRLFLPANRASNATTATNVREDSGIPNNVVVPRAPKKKPHVIPSLTPQQYLESLLRSRGHSTEHYNVLDTAYYAKPTSLQEASYGVYIVDVVRRNDVTALSVLLTVGMHPNACNSYGESIVHLACRRGNYQSLQTMIDHQCIVQVADDYGRTPLHDLCWAAEPSFQAAALVLAIDPNLLFMKDARGSLPLAYSSKEHWAGWIQFLESRKDEYWPKRDSSNQIHHTPPILTRKAPHSVPMPDPFNALSETLAAMVASGKMTPEEVQVLRDDCCYSSSLSSPSTTPMHASEDDEEDDEDDDDDDGSESESSNNDDSSSLIDELSQMLGGMPRKS